MPLHHLTCNLRRGGADMQGLRVAAHDVACPHRHCLSPGCLRWDYACENVQDHKARRVYLRVVLGHGDHWRHAQVRHSRNLACAHACAHSKPCLRGVARVERGSPWLFSQGIKCILSACVVSLLRRLLRRHTLLSKVLVQFSQTHARVPHLFVSAIFADSCKGASPFCQFHPFNSVDQKFKTRCRN